MARHTEEEELREDYYIHCRKRGYAVDEASERSLAYMKRVFNAESLTNTSYLEQLYQERIEQPRYSSSPFSYHTDPPTHSARQTRHEGRHDAFHQFSSMMDSLFTDDSRSFRNMGMEHEENWSIPSVPSHRIPEYIPSSWDYQSNAREPLKEFPNDRSTPHYRAPEYIPSVYDYQSNVQKPREESGRCTDSHDTPPHSSSYNRPSRPRSKSSYKTESRRPFPSHSYSASDSNNPSRSRSPPSYTFYSSPDEYSNNPSYSFRPVLQIQVLTHVHHRHNAHSRHLHRVSSQPQTSILYSILAEVLQPLISRKRTVP
jgi:hypothetical protein